MKKKAGSPLAAWMGRELRLDLPHLGPPNPGMAWIHREPEVHEDADDEPLTVLGGNMAGIWYVLAGDGSVHWVDDTERDLASGIRLFDDLTAFAAELARQNG